MGEKRKIFYFKDYFRKFFEAQTENAKDKIDYILYLVTVAERIPRKFFNKMTAYNGLWEIRVEFKSNIYRIFCCFDEGNLVVLFNGFQKKSQKTPKKEIEKAMKIKNEYFELKNKKDLL